MRYDLHAWAVARLCALSSLLQHLSNSAACHLLPAAAVAPGPKVSSLPKSEYVWHLTVKTPSLRLRESVFMKIHLWQLHIRYVLAFVELFHSTRIPIILRHYCDQCHQ